MELQIALYSHKNLDIRPMKTCVSALICFFSLICSAWAGPTTAPVPKAARISVETNSAATSIETLKAADSFCNPTNVFWASPFTSPTPEGGTKAVIYKVMNVQSNQCGVFVVSRPLNPNPRLPLVVECLEDETKERGFRLETIVQPMFPNAPPNFPTEELMDRLVVWFSKVAPNGGLETNYGHVNLG